MIELTPYQEGFLFGFTICGIIAGAWFTKKINDSSTMKTFKYPEPKTNERLEGAN